MSVLSLAVIVLLGAVLVLGIAWGAPIFAIPIVLVGIAFFGLGNLRRRVGDGNRLGRFRGQARRASPERSVELTGHARDAG